MNGDICNWTLLSSCVIVLYKFTLFRSDHILHAILQNLHLKTDLMRHVIHKHIFDHILFTLL